MNQQHPRSQQTSSTDSQHATQHTTTAKAVVGFKPMARPGTKTLQINSTKNTDNNRSTSTPQATRRQHHQHAAHLDHAAALTGWKHNDQQHLPTLDHDHDQTASRSRSHTETAAEPTQNTPTHPQGRPPKLCLQLPTAG